MNPKHIIWGLVIVVAVLFSIIYAALGNNMLAVLAFGLGGMWLAVDAKVDGYEGTFFFLAFVALAVIASLNEALRPLPLLGLSVDLAAWDVSRFSARLAGEKDQTARAILEARHLTLLIVVIGSGFLIALLPFLFQLAIPFVIMSGLALFALLALQQSMRSLSQDHGQDS
jgi:hypothetical protein